MKRTSRRSKRASRRNVSDWRDAPVSVHGRMFKMGDVYGGKLYHGSPYELDNGTVLVPGARAKNYKQSLGHVSITSDLGTAEWCGSLEGTVDVYVYEVEPIGEIEAWRVMSADYGKSFMLQEGVTPSALITARAAFRRAWRKPKTKRSSRKVTS